jgi:hypothetical protein
MESGPKASAGYFLASRIGRVRRSGPIGVVIVLGIVLASCADPTGGTDAGDPAPPDVARVVCDADGTHVETPSVSPQLDGVHVLIDNRLGFDTGFATRFGNGAGAGENAPQGESAHVLQAPPGTVEIGCYASEGALDQPELQPFDVVDPDGVYRSVELDCASVVSGTGDYAEGAQGLTGAPTDLARDRFDDAYGLAAGDVVERAGYPQSGTPIVRLVRDGRTLATVSYLGAEDGGWLQETLSACDELMPA